MSFVVRILSPFDKVCQFLDSVAVFEASSKNFLFGCMKMFIYLPTRYLFGVYNKPLMYDLSNLDGILFIYS